MRWLFQPKPSTRASFPVGKYAVDAPIEGFTGLTEFSPTEYAIMERTFESEKNYNASPLTFLGCKWKVMLGTVHGRVYKIACCSETKNEYKANRIARKILNYCTKKLGSPASQQTGLFTWMTTDGNVIFQLAQADEAMTINLFVTSRSVRSFKTRLHVL